MSSVSCFSMGFYFALVQSLYLYESRSAFVWVAENKRFFLYLVDSLWFDEFSRRIERHHVLTSGQTQDHVWFMEDNGLFKELSQARRQGCFFVVVRLVLMVSLDQIKEYFWFDQVILVAEKRVTTIFNEIDMKQCLQDTVFGLVISFHDNHTRNMVPTLCVLEQINLTDVGKQYAYVSLQHQSQHKAFVASVRGLSKDMGISYILILRCSHFALACSSGFDWGSWIQFSPLSENY